MNDTTLNSNAASAPATKRNAVLAAVGIGLAGLGLAAGLAMRPSGPVPTVATPVPVAATAAPAQAPVPPTQVADAAAVPATPAATVAPVEAPPARRESRPLREQSQPAPGRSEDGRQVASNDGARSVTPLQTRPVAVCSTCGVVEAVRTVEREGHGSGVGAVAGGVLGGVLGNRFGGGSGRTALTVLGAVGGGLAGNEAEKRTRTSTAYDIRVRMDDGTLRTFEQTTQMSPGTKVTVDGQTLRLRSAGASDYGS